MRVRVVLLLCIASVGALAIFNAGWRVASTLRECYIVRHSQQTLSGLWTAIELNAAMGKEREVLFGRWLSSEPSPAGLSSDLLSDDAFERVIANSGMYVAADIATLHTDIAAMRNARRQVIEAEQRPWEAGSANLLDGYLSASGVAERALSGITELLQQQLTRSSPESSNLAKALRLAQIESSIESLRRSVVALQVLDPEESRHSLRQMTDVTARRDYIWEQIKLSLADRADMDVFGALLEKISTKLDGDARKADMYILDILHKSGDQSADVERYLASRQPVIDELISLRDIAHHELTARLASDERVEFSGLAFALLSVVAALVITATASWQVLRRVARPLSELTGVVTRIAQDELDMAVPGGERRDELGDLARAVLILQERSAEAKRLRQTAAGEQQRKLDAARLLIDAARAFEQSSGTRLVQVQSEESSLKSVVVALDEFRNRGELLSTGAADDATRAASSVNALAVAVDKVVDTARVVSGRMERAGAVANSAASEATSALSHIGELTDMAARIGTMVDAIAKIANRTKLLSLNATIEAARAGVAGRGFAVVASEVKSLASQTAQATDEVAAHVTGIQLATSRATTGIQTLVAQVGALSEAAAAVAAAVEQQGAATDQIAFAAQRAAAGTEQAAAQVLTFQASATRARSIAASLPGIADGITGSMTALRSEINRFLTTVREVA